MKDKKPEYDVLKVAIEQVRDFDTKIIEVENCEGCPFVEYDAFFGYYACSQKELDLRGWQSMPDKGVHPGCPLFTNNYKIKLKE